MILIQEWWGLNKSICAKADAEAGGFAVMAIDIYTGKVADSREKAGHLMGGLDFGAA